jgi:GNAT superfamily N-acetyltransferase
MPVSEPDEAPEASLHEPDMRLAAVAEDGSQRAHCSLWWRNTPALRGRRCGVIGHYRSADDEGGRLLLAHACRELAGRGCGDAIGPMNGSTWHAYRFVTERGSEPQFFLEPDNDDAWPRQFMRSGFHPLATYRSALQSDLTLPTKRIDRLLSSISATNLRIRCLDLRHAEEELEKLHALVHRSFRDSLFYMPLSVEQFVRLHAPLLRHVRPELVLVAERGQQFAAMLFALPDLAQAQRQAVVDTVIVKTVAALPGRHHAGLAHLLAVRAAPIARELGYRRAIHALMRDAIESANWSARHAVTMRRYTLYARQLSS